LVIDPIAQRHIDRVALAPAKAHILQVSRPWKELAMLMERDGHDTVCCVKGLFYSIPVVDINVNVEDPLMVLEQFQYCQDNVVDVAEARGFASLGMVQATGPVDHRVGLAVVELDGTSDGATSRNLAVLKEPIEYWTVLAHVD